MHMLASFDCKFRTNQDKIEEILQHFGLRKIQATLYVGELDNNERKTLVKNINEIRVSAKINFLI